MKALILLTGLFLLFASCGKQDDVNKTSDKTTKQNEKTESGQSNVKDDVSDKDIVKIAVGSSDHTTLVTALKAAELVEPLANPGPFTVFAPTNAAFDKLPKGTLDDLLKPENKSKLTSILQHHVQVSVYTIDMLSDGQTINMFDGNPAKITKKDGVTYIDKAKILASIRGSNGIVHVIDEVVLPSAK